MYALKSIANVKGDSGVILDAKYNERDASTEEWASILDVRDKAVGSWMLGMPSKEILGHVDKTANRTPLHGWAEWVKRHFYLSMLKSVPLVLLKKYKIFCSDAVDGAPVVLGIAETLSTGATEGAEISSSKISNAFALDVGGAFPFEESSSENWSPTSFAISSFPLGTSLPTS
ncbi:hypothetical protein V6N11_017727 [Hibiscus sabdariffa]|uniref:Uncharacterized protein n=1 Tax=Hibiscus sabdariffa TaxID=183260 RepID=A0ABR2TZ05_9ROSI